VAGQVDDKDAVMRVAMLYYPMLFQRTGGLQVQVLETTRALQQAGVDAVLFDYREHKLADFDIAHVFSAINGNHRIVEQARSDGLSVVLSTVLHPPWGRSQETRSNLISKVAARLSGWSLNTTHQHIHSCLSGAAAVIALGDLERDMLVNGYGTPGHKVHIVPNGIKQAFFEAGERLFRERFGITGPYALNVASVSPYKNQMTALRALKGKLPLVVLGPCAKENQDYLQAMQDFGGEWFHYLGVLDNDDPALPSAYAGASLFVLPSQTEVQPISALEALAADRPVIITKNHSLDMLPDRSVLHEVIPNDAMGISSAAQLILSKQGDHQGQQRAQVTQLTWEAAARDLNTIYQRLMAQTGTP
jgi:glycosyltransferase involved in cell wall biosynthesis